MTTSALAITTDVIKNGKPVVGYGFNSNGRYAPTCLLEERFIPRLMEAAPKDIVADDGSNLDPHKIHKIIIANEKPGGHGERAVAVGVIDMAVWDAVAKIEEKPLYQLLADRYGTSKTDDKVYIYAAGGYYFPDKGLTALQDEMRGYLDLGYRDVKMKVGGASLNEDLQRIEAVLDILPKGSGLMVDANGRFGLDYAMGFEEKADLYELLLAIGK